MIVFDTLFILLILYLFIYCIYQLFFYIKANDIDKFFEIHEKIRNIIDSKKKLCIIIYASVKDKKLDKLLNALNNQTYEKEFYDVHVAYKKDENDTSFNKDFILGARIHNIQNPDYFSKDKAVNLLLKKLLAEEKYEAFVFLNPDRMVGEKYLENVNKSLDKSSVTVGSKISYYEENHIPKIIKNSIISAYLKYTNRTKNIVRAMFQLPYFIDGGNFAVTSDIVEKMGYVGIENKDSELEYSLDLASNDIISIYSPYVITAIDVRNYDFSSPTIKGKINLFSHYFNLLMFKNIVFKEFILFLMKPDSLIVLLSYFILVYFCVCAPQHVSQLLVCILGVFLFFNFLISVYISKMKLSELFWLLFYPACLIWQKLKLFSGNLTQRSIMKSRYEEENVNSATINATANNGKKDFPCKLDLVSEDGMRKAVFREGNRFITTDSFLRMFDALEDITYKLKTKGITLKICQNCKNFTICPDGTLDCLNGKCNISNSEILVWNGCQYFELSDDKKEEE